jgi:8-oxo-dGTP diphosphatase
MILAVDVVLLTVREALEVLLLRREDAPYAGAWALPGAFVRPDEGIEAAARRVLRDKVGLADVYVEQLYTFGEPERDPRGRVVSVAHYALVPAARLELPSDDLHLAPVYVSPLPFDHEDILATAVRRLRGKLDASPVGYELLPERFTLSQLQRVHERILGRGVNKDSFRRRMVQSGELEPTGELRLGAGRPAELFRHVR